jgi:EmrB/QacA subfamily drug resistance transporter
MTTRRTGSKWWTLAAMCFALFMIMVDNTVVNVALPSIQHSLHASPAALEWTINSYVLAFAVLIMVGGKLGDRFGRKRMFLVGLIVFTLGSAACALAPTDGWLVAFRALQGVGGALMSPLSLSIIVAAFPRRQVGTAIGFWAGISALGLAVGPLLGGVLVDHVSWSAVFWINVPIGVVAAIVTLAAVSESRDPGARRLDLVGTGLVTGALFCLVYGLIETSSHAWLSTFTLTFLGAAAVLLALFVAWERRAAEPMVPLELFRRRRFTVASVAVAFVGLGLFGVVFFITLYFQNVKGWSPTRAGMASLPLTGMIMLLGPWSGRLQARFGARALITAGLLSCSAGLIGLAQIGVSTSYWLIWPFYVAMGVGLAIAMPATSATAMGAVETERAGIASGVVNASRQVGAAMGIAILGAVGSAVAVDRWHERAASLPEAIRAGAGRLNELVVGGQVRAVGRIAGPQAADDAAHAFVGGVRAAMWVAAALVLAAAITAFVGLGGGRPAPGAVPAAEPEAARVPRPAGSAQPA